MKTVGNINNIKLSNVTFIISQKVQEHIFNSKLLIGRR